MGIFQRLFGSSSAAQRSASASPLAAATPQKRAEPLEATHPVFRLEAGMDKQAVIALLGTAYLSVSSDQVFAFLAKQGASVIRMDDEADPEECWLYGNEPQGHDIEIVFRSGLLVSVEVKKKNPGTRAILLVRIDQKGRAAAEPYQAAFGAKTL